MHCHLWSLALATQSVVTLDTGASQEWRHVCADDVETMSLLQSSPTLKLPAAMLDSKQEVTQDDPHDWSRRASSYREQLGLRLNGRGDLAAFLAAVALNSAGVLVMLFGCSILWKHFPEVYSANTMGDDPRMPLLEHEKTGVFARYHAVQRVLRNDNLVEVTVGLDHCMIIEYTCFAMKLMTVIGLPLVFILAPLHLMLGTRARDLDLLNMIGFTNVDAGNPVCWVHGFVVWYVVCATQWLIFESQGKFMDRRMAWLKRMPHPRSNTILVENIETAYCSDAKLRDYFNEAFDEDVVEEAYVVRNTTHLLALLHSLEDHKFLLEEAQAQVGADGPVSADAMHHSVSHTLFTLDHLGEEVDSIDFYTEKIRKLKDEVAAERSRIHEVVNEEGLNETVFCHAGFVTFRKRVNCEHALKHQFSKDRETFVVSAPPDPRDIRFPALQAENLVAPAWTALGYLSVAGIFFSFLPLVAAISSFTCLHNLCAVVPLLDSIVHEHWELAKVWDGIASSLMLTTLMSLVPMCLIMVFQHFFVMKSDMFMQHKVQHWYFYFLLVFVVLVTCIGTSLSAAVEDILADPTNIIWRMADTMPFSTNFYLEFFLAQTAAHVSFLARIFPLMKFLMVKPLLGAERAKELCEPEDQAYYGIGSRSAILTLLLVTALVFCTLQPLICVLCYVFFAIVRLIYGNLFLLAETEKVDLGGVFWVTQLKQTQQGLIIYILLMCGVLFRRAGGYGPGVIALSSLALLFESYARFDNAYPWEGLPFAEVVHTSVHQGTMRRNSLQWKPQQRSPSKLPLQSSLSSIPEKSTSLRRLSFNRQQFKASHAEDRYEQRELLEELESVKAAEPQ